MRNDGQWDLMKRVEDVLDKDGWLVASSNGYLEYPKRDESNIALGLCNQLWDSKPHRHLYHEMVVVLKGYCLHEYRGVQVPLIPGDAFLVFPHESHGYHVDSPIEILNIWFYPERLSAGVTEMLGYIRETTRILSQENAEQDRWHMVSDISGRRSGQPQTHQNRQSYLNQQGIVYLNAEEKNRVEELISLLFKEQEEQKTGYEYMKSACLSMILTLVWRISEEQGRMKEYIADEKRDTVNRILGYMEEHLEEKLDIGELAQKSCWSPSHFRAVFKSVTGLSPLEYLNRLRIIKSMEYLSGSSVSVAEAAERVGILDQAYFSRLFKKIIGYSPRYFKSVTDSVFESDIE